MSDLDGTPTVMPEVIDKKSEDKLEIEDEERKKMIGGNEEVSRSEVEKKKKALEEAAEGAARRRAPIGGIRVPGFLRASKSKEKTKEGDGDAEEGTDLLETQKATEKPESGETNPEKPTAGGTGGGPAIPILSKFGLSVPFIKRKKSPEEAEEVKQGGGAGEEHNKTESTRPKLINAIRLPIASLVPKKLKPTKGPAEVESAITPGQAGLASMETLDESNGSKNEDNMETIKLDNVELDPEKAALEDHSESKWARKDWRNTWQLIKERKLVLGCAAALTLLLVIVLILYLCLRSSPPEHAPIIDGKYVTAVSSCGPIEGVLEDGVFGFRGVPYALPPLKRLRFAHPAPLTLADCWNGTFKAHNSTPSCWHMSPSGTIDGVEDCLTLDIFTPQVRYDSPLPVVIAVGLEKPDLQLDPRLSSEMVLVKPRVRQGPLGFTASTPLSEATYPRSSGNYGLLDLLAAVRWVSLNVEHFGGDSKAITLLGYRQGATLVAALTTIHKPQNLFKRVWLSSGSAVFPTNTTLFDSEKLADEYMKALPCPTAPSADCLRNLDVEELLDAVPDSWRPVDRGNLPSVGKEKHHQWLVQDGKIIREGPYEVWARGELQIDILIGTTLHSETDKEWREDRISYSAEDVKQQLANSAIGRDGLTNQVLSMYNATVEGLAEVISDIRTVCPLYFMYKQIPQARFYLVNQVSKDGLAYGGQDMSVIFKSPSDKNQKTNHTQEFLRYSDTMINLFQDFVTSGNTPKYRFTFVGPEIVQVREGLPRCEFWKQKGYSKYAWID